MKSAKSHFLMSSTLSLLKLGSLIKRLRRLLQRKRHIKGVLCVRLSVTRLFQVDHVVQTRRNVPSLPWHEWFSCKAKNERFSAAGSRCRQSLKYENFTSSFSRLRQIIAPKSVLHACNTIIFPHSTNQITDLWRCR